jgi:ribosomal protein L20A (L18A)
MKRFLIRGTAVSNKISFCGEIEAEDEKEALHRFNITEYIDDIDIEDVPEITCEEVSD